LIAEFNESFFLLIVEDFELFGRFDFCFAECQLSFQSLEVLGELSGLFLEKVFFLISLMRELFFFVKNSQVAFLFLLDLEGHIVARLL
jgi:hypothetical protein